MIFQRKGGYFGTFIVVIFLSVLGALSSTTVPSATPATGNGGGGKIKVSTYEKDLLATLLTNYSTSARPTSSNHEPVYVNFELRLNKIVKLDMKEQLLVINAKLFLKWRDPQLAWNMSEWNGTNYLNVPNSKIWTPDIMLYNTARDDSRDPSDMYKTKVLINHDGDIIWVAPVTLKASCAVDIKWFPFDNQECKLTFGSLSYTRSRLNIRFRKQPKNAAGMQGNFHYSNGDWDISSVSSRQLSERYEWSPEPYALIEYSISLKRMFTYYMLYLVLPCLGLVFLGPFMFYLPADSGERTGFGVTVVLALSVYLLVISDQLPEKSDRTPLIGALYIVIFFLLVLALSVGIVTTHLCYKTNEPPKWLWRVLFKKKQHLRPIDTVKENQMKSDGLVMQTMETVAQQRPDLTKRFSTISGEVIPTIDEAETNQHKWRIISAKIDKIMFWCYLAMVIVIPAIVCVCFI
ncbi:neuronal acetylcholine receptor subunit alpha-7-like [Rhopilema esculentum]|uniref:neuronal acetylcholine receptor subunit alpha-7-like n=1 Tax=Rhopilema esculentum TaxID=499914 RepID=UPI0031CE00CF